MEALPEARNETPPSKNSDGGGGDCGDVANGGTDDGDDYLEDDAAIAFALTGSNPRLIPR